MLLISFFFLAYSLSEIKKTKRLLINVTLAIAVQKMEEKICDRKIMVHILSWYISYHLRIIKIKKDFN